MKGLIIALQFMTRLPMPRVEVSGSDFAHSMHWFPAVGAMIGLFLAGAAWLGLSLSPMVGALAALLVWVGITGALHLDGLGDITDAAGAAHKGRERLLEVLGDPHIGSFGMVAIALLLLSKFVLLLSLLTYAIAAPQLLWALVAISFAARIGPLVWTRYLPTLHPGLGAKFKGVVRPVDLAIWSIALLAVSYALPAMLTILVIIPAWGWWLMKRIGGISGDGHGAGIEISEALLLFATLAMVRFA